MPGAILRIVLLLPIVVAGAGCVSHPTGPQISHIGFQNPEQTFRSFQTAVRGDAYDLMYRSLSADLRSRERLSRFAMAEGWELMRRRNPFLKRIATAEIVESVRIAPRRHEITALVDTWFIDVRFRVWLVPDTFREVWADGRAVVDEYAQFEQHFKVQEDGAGNTWITVQTLLPANVEPADVDEIRYGTFWKIDGFQLLGDEHLP